MTAWLSVEGLNGVGKTYLCRRWRARLDPDVQLVSELTDTVDTFTAAVISALSTGRSFLRTGFPRTETMTLIALKVREYEHVAALRSPPRVVVEDRGMDTVALYQAAILTSPDEPPPDDPAPAEPARAPRPGGERAAAMRAVATQIAETAAAWRPAPARTLVLVDDLDACAARFHAREGRPLAPDEYRLLGEVDTLYRWLAEREPHRVHLVPLPGRDPEDVLDELDDHLAQLTAPTESAPVSAVAGAETRLAAGADGAS